MNRVNRAIGRQFGDPRGVIGKVCCKIMNVINRKMYLSVFGEISASENSVILDVGYGNGYLIQRLFKRFQCTLYGIEISPDAEKFACKKNKWGVKNGKIKLILADCTDMPFASERFDAVTTVNTVYFWKDTEKGLSEIYRVLKRGGTFYSAVYEKEWLKKRPYTQSGFQFFEREDYLDLGRRAGFSDVQIKEIKRGKNFLVVYAK